MIHTYEHTTTHTNTHKQTHTCIYIYILGGIKKYLRYI